MKTSDIESLIGKTVTIDSGQKKLENGEIAEGILVYPVVNTQKKIDKSGL